ncbi:hypothetical protein MNBD_ALPHA04-150 [hydrothermal vent metagenome]|uniref:Uncharacterized protein n=1 Tax=hydrothermal vent metagenome TaxID=652676 RepID=A0A3B0R5E2_9ZZZZ
MLNLIQHQERYAVIFTLDPESSWYISPSAKDRHCERSEAIQKRAAKLDCRVATLLAMTKTSLNNAIVGARG